MGKDLDDEMREIEKREKLEAVILCGGEGWKSKLEEPTPKPLIEIKDEESLLDLQIRWLIGRGFDRIILASNRTYAESKYFQNPKVEMCIERSKLGTGGAVKRASTLIDAGKFYVMNVDDLVSYNPRRLFELATHGAAVLLARPQLPFGKITLQDDEVVDSYEDRPTIDFWVNAGHYVFSKEVVAKYFPTEGDFEAKAMQKIVKARLLKGLKYEGEWLTINTMKDLTRIKDYFGKSVSGRTVAETLDPACI